MRDVQPVSEQTALTEIPGIRQTHTALAVAGQMPGLTDNTFVTDKLKRITDSMRGVLEASHVIRIARAGIFQDGLQHSSTIGTWTCLSRIIRVQAG